MRQDARLDITAVGPTNANPPVGQRLDSLYDKTRNFQASTPHFVQLRRRACDLLYRGQTESIPPNEVNAMSRRPSHSRLSLLALALLAFNAMSCFGTVAARAELVLHIAMTAADIPDWTGQPDQGFQRLSLRCIQSLRRPRQLGSISQRSRRLVRCATVSRRNGIPIRPIPSAGYSSCVMVSPSTTVARGTPMRRSGISPGSCRTSSFGIQSDPVRPLALANQQHRYGREDRRLHDRDPHQRASN